MALMLWLLTPALLATFVAATMTTLPLPAGGFR